MGKKNTRIKIIRLKKKTQQQHKIQDLYATCVHYSGMGFDAK